MPTVSLVRPGTPVKADAVVVGIQRSKRGAVLAAGSEAISGALGDRLPAALQALGATGKPEEVVKIPTLGLTDIGLVVAAGLGDRGPVEAEAARRAIGAAVRSLGHVRRVHLALEAPTGALAEGALLGAYTFTEYKSAPDTTKLRRITIAAPNSERDELRRAEIVAGAIALTRDFVNTPPNILFPKSFAKRATRLARDHGLEVEVLHPAELEAGHYGGILAVGSGSRRPPRLVRISYRPDSPVAHVALIGKGITFDSGGLNLKTAGMAAMKSDMSGAAAVICAIVALADLKVAVAVTATVPMAENLASEKSIHWYLTTRSL